MNPPFSRTVFNTQTFRLACLFSLAVLVFISLISGFIFWQTSVGIIQRADDVLLRDAHIMADEKTDAVVHFLERRLAARNHVIVAAGLFDAQGNVLGGNLVTPPHLIADGKVHSIPPDETCCDAINRTDGRILAAPLSDGRVLVLGRNVEGVETLRQTIEEALLAGVAPSVLFALVIGTFMGRKTAMWMQNIQSMTQRIESGEIWQRLPVPDSNDQTRWLVESMNRILDGVGQIFDTTRSTNEHLAHDLLAPLSGIRARLERASATASDIEDMRNSVVLAISGLDQTAKLASALLKISTIERGHIRNHFHPVDPAQILSEVEELFSVIAEDKNITLTITTPPVPPLMGDQDLLMEAVANLVDNAIKYTPSGGHVHLYLDRQDNRTVIGIKDNGPGLPPDQCQRVLGRYARSGSTPQISGHGLGLTLVDAVVRLHGMSLKLEDAGPGLSVEIIYDQ